MKYASIDKPIEGLKPKRVYLLEKSSTAFVFIVQYKDMTLSAHMIESGIERKLWTR